MNNKNDMFVVHDKSFNKIATFNHISDAKSFKELHITRELYIRTWFDYNIKTKGTIR